MVYPFYEHPELISPESEAPLASLAAALRKGFGGHDETVVIHTEADRIVITISDYQFRIYLNDEPHVQEESEEMAAIFDVDYADNSINKIELARCQRRFELAGEKDPDADYFNDSLTILDAMEEVGGVIILMPG